jgi:hypothetical protein
MACARLSDGQTLLAVNDLFVGQRSHVSARYQISQGEASEAQSSSGVIISTGLGSTGWLKSILAGAAGVLRATNEGMSEVSIRTTLPWDADSLLFSVREPFPSKATKTNLVFGQVTPACPLRIVSHMPESGVSFSDGIENDFLEFNAGMEARIALADRKGLLVV